MVVHFLNTADCSLLEIQIVYNFPVKHEQFNNQDCQGIPQAAEAGKVLYDCVNQDS